MEKLEGKEFVKSQNRNKGKIYKSILIIFIALGVFYLRDESIASGKIFTTFLIYTGVLLLIIYDLCFKEKTFIKLNFKFKELKLDKTLKGIYYCILFFIMSNCLTWFLSGYGNFEFHSKLGSVNFSKESYLRISIFIITIFILVPIVEEIIYRGAVFKEGIPKNGLKSSIVISSIIFSYTYGISNGTVFILSGLPVYLAYIYYKEKNILYPIIFHGFSNLLYIFPKLNYNLGDSSKIYIILFVLVVPIILRKMYQIFILEKETLEF